MVSRAGTALQLPRYFQWQEVHQCLKSLQPTTGNPQTYDIWLITNSIYDNCKLTLRFIITTGFDVTMFKHVCVKNTDILPVDCHLFSSSSHLLVSFLSCIENVAPLFASYSTFDAYVCGLYALVAWVAFQLKEEEEQRLWLLLVGQQADKATAKTKGKRQGSLPLHRPNLSRNSTLSWPSMLASFPPPPMTPPFQLPPSGKAIPFQPPPPPPAHPFFLSYFFCYHYSGCLNFHTQPELSLHLPHPHPDELFTI